MEIVLAWLLGAAFGAFTVWQVCWAKLGFYESWFSTLKWIIEDYYGGKVETNMKTGDCGVDF